MTSTIQEIQAALNLVFSDKSLNIQVNHAGNQLAVMINRPISQRSVSYEAIAEILMAKLRSFSLPT